MSLFNSKEQNLNSRQEFPNGSGKKSEHRIEGAGKSFRKKEFHPRKAILHQTDHKIPMQLK